MSTRALANPVAAAVADLRSGGYGVCKPDPAEKRPTYLGWVKRSLESHHFGPSDQVGILCGPLSNSNKPGHSLVVVDKDTSLAIERAPKFLPPTAMIDGRRSKPKAHSYYLVPNDSIPEWAWSQAEQAAPAAKAAAGHVGPYTRRFLARNSDGSIGGSVIDLLGTGAQALCPPSLGNGGEPREWEGGMRGEPSIIPFQVLLSAVADLANDVGAVVPRLMPHVATHTRLEPITGSNVIARARKYLAKCPPAIDGQHGHDTAFTVARALVWGFCLDGETAYTLLAEWSSTCQPPWAEWELRHKLENADSVPFSKPRGYLRDEPLPGRNGNGSHKTQPSAARITTSPGPSVNGHLPSETVSRAPVSQKKADEPLTGAETILNYFKEEYQPRFRRGNAIATHDGEIITMGVACEVPNSALIECLANAKDAPRRRVGQELEINRNGLPGFFKTWSKVAWGDLLKNLPDEDTADLASVEAAADEFRRLVRDAMLSEIVLGDVIKGTTVTQTERRSLIDWCVKFAKPGPWRSIRSKRCWCKVQSLPDGEIRLKVAIRHELFAQVKADRKLSSMGANTFTRRAARYGVGASSRADRPHGQPAVVLSDEFVDDLTASLPSAILNDGATENEVQTGDDAER